MRNNFTNNERYYFNIARTSVKIGSELWLYVIDNSSLKFRANSTTISFPANTNYVVIKRLSVSPYYLQIEYFDTNDASLGTANYNSIQIWAIYMEYRYNNIVDDPDDSGYIYYRENSYQASLELELYQLQCEKHKVGKKTTGSPADIKIVTRIYGTPRENISLSNPSIIFEYSNLLGLSSGYFNYVYIREWNRWYFLSSLDIIRNKVYQMNLHVDVLQSYATDIRSQSAFISRNENTTDSYLADERIPLKDYPTISFNASLTGTRCNVTWNYYSGSGFTINDDNVAFCVINDLSPASNQDAVKPSSTDLPTLKRAVGSNPLITPYALTYKEWGYVTEKIKDQSSLAGYVLGATCYPFKLTPDCERDGNDVLVDELVKINNVQVKDDTDTDVTSHKLKSESSCYWVIADFSITKAYSGYQSYLNFEPYTQFELYIPFKGWVKLPAYESYGSIIVYYALDYVTGDGSVYVYNDTNEKVVYSSPIQVGIKLGVTATNIQELTKQKQTNATNLALGLISSTASVAVGIATENPVGVVAGLLSGTHTIASAVNINRMMIEKADCVISGDRIGLYGGYKPILKTITYGIASGYDASTFGKLQGFKVNKYSSLSSITGYTEIPELHYTPSSQKWITSDEIDEIVSLAKTGIIL